jgi:hypothetical protein
MAKSPEELREIINKEEAALLIKAKQQLLTLVEQEALRKLQERLIDDEGMNMDELPSVEQLQQLHMPAPKPYTAQSTSAEVSAQIFADFAKEYGKENIRNNGLCFPDDEKNSKADKFFRSQAEKGHAFLFKQSGCDNYAFSDGKGHYKMGSQEDIIAFCKKNSLDIPQALDSEHTAQHDRSASQSL